MSAPDVEARAEAGPLPDVAFAVVLAGLGDMTPARLRLLLDGEDARLTFDRLVGGDPELEQRLCRLGGSARPQPVDEPLDMEACWGYSGSPEALRRTRVTAQAHLRRWRREAAVANVAAAWDDLRQRGISVARRGRPPYPSRLERAREAPELLYVRGSLDKAGGPCVAIVGTRQATHYGLGVAGELAHELAAAGVVVVSGLAPGIDSAAHRGALAAGGEAPPLAVVGGGVDVVYPPENRRLLEAVAATGALVSEAPPGAAPEGWRFPLRNRLIAALAQVLVVVELSHQSGAMHTVLAADAYGVPVMAVPGSIRSPQSEGTNAIIQEGGAGLVRDPRDVLVALATACQEDGTPVPPALRRRGWLSSASPGGRLHRPVAPPEPPRTEALTPTERAVLEAVDESGTATDVVCLRTQLELGVVALVLDRLEELGAVRNEGASWVRS